MPDYTFDTLSDYEFESLARDLLQAEMEITLESFKKGRDMGIDLRYARDDENTLVVQCKHYSTSGTSKLKSHLRNQEVLKVNKLKPQRYLIVTSVGLNPQDKIDILDIFTPYCKSTADIYGQNDINN